MAFSSQNFNDTHDPINHDKKIIKIIEQILQLTASLLEESRLPDNNKIQRSLMFSTINHLFAISDIYSKELARRFKEEKDAQISSQKKTSHQTTANLFRQPIAYIPIYLATENISLPMHVMGDTQDNLTCDCKTGSFSTKMQP